MRYLIVLHSEDDRTDYGVTVPDLPGCVSAGDTLAEALGNAEEAILCHLDGTIADGEPIPNPSVDSPQDLPAGCMVAVVEIDLNKLALSGKTVRLNVSIPERTVALIDRAAKRAGTSRSNFLTQAAMAFIERESRIT